jgi:hypothetical protein
MKIIWGHDNLNSSIDGDPHNFIEIGYRRNNDDTKKRPVLYSDFLDEGIKIDYKNNQQK